MNNRRHIKSAALFIAIALLGSHRLAFADVIPTITVSPSESTVFNITQNANLWYFDGANGTLKYNSFAYLKAFGPTQGTFVWQATTNPGAVDIGSDEGAPRTTINYPYLAMKSNGVSTSPGDVTINLKYNGDDVGNFNLTVYAPDSAELFGSVDHQAIFWGYKSVGLFTILDQFGDELTELGLGFHEEFDDDGRVDVYSGNTWPSPSAIPGTILNAKIPGTNFLGIEDTWSASILVNPTSINPCTPTLCTEEVFNIPQEYFAGSVSEGSGRQFNSQTVHYFTDHATP